MNLHTTATDYLRRHIERGCQLTALLVAHPCAMTPSTDTTPSVWVKVGGLMFADPAGDERVKLKLYQIGVAFYWRDGRNEHAVFDARQLWDDIVNPKPVQLAMPLVFESIQVVKA